MCCEISTSPGGRYPPFQHGTAAASGPLGERCAAPEARFSNTLSISTGALTSREWLHERHDGYTQKDGASEHPGAALGCSFRVNSGLMDSSGQGHTQN